MEPGRQGRLMRQAARVRRRVRADPVPGAARRCPGDRPVRQRIIHPCKIGAVVIGDRQRCLRHRTRHRTVAAAQRQHHDFITLDQGILEHRHSERLAVLAVGEAQGTAHRTVVDARQCIETARRVVDREAMTVAAGTIDRNNRLRTCLANTVRRIAKLYYGGRRRLVCARVNPYIVQHPAERPLGKQVGARMPTEADSLASQD